MRLAGIVLDIYDDTRGEILAAKVASAGLPDAWADSQLSTPEHLAALPDRLFAFVADTEHGAVRKYAMHDGPHVGTSIMYFLDRLNYFPAAVREKVAANLVNACAWYDLEPPPALVKLAFLATALNAVSGIAEGGNQLTRHRKDMDAARQAQATGIAPAKTAAGRVVELTAEDDRRIQKGGQGVGATDLFNDWGTRASAHARLESAEKKATPEWQHCGDVSGMEPDAIPGREVFEHYALPHLQRYAIDTVEQVKSASAYFDEHARDFPPELRRVYADELCARATTLEVKLAGRVLDYAGNGFGPFVESEIMGRVLAYEGTSNEPAYAVLAEKWASMSPEALAVVLTEVDNATGASTSYGSTFGFRDPYAAVFGSAKSAAFAPEPNEVFSWADGPDYVSGPSLVALAGRESKLDSVFGAGFEKSYKKDPVGIFKSLPDPQKVVLSRLAR